jgi:hypothetical protein
MKIISVYFERRPKFIKYKNVFMRSAAKCMPDTKIELIQPDLPKNIDHKRDTAFAFIEAAEYVILSNESLAVCDIDLMFLKSILDVEKIKYDIAVTVRNGKMKYNTGLWFTRPTEETKIFIKRWIKNTKFIMANFCKYEEFSWTHGGIDQASLYMTIQQIKNIKIIELPCLEWNATQSEWKHVNKNTRVIHVKSKLAQACFGKKEIIKSYPYLKPLVKKWKGYR